MDQLATISTFTTGVRPRDWPADESEGPAFMSDASQNENVSRPYWPLKPRKADAVNIVSRGMLLACALLARGHRLAPCSDPGADHPLSFLCILNLVCLLVTGGMAMTLPRTSCLASNHQRVCCHRIDHHTHRHAHQYSKPARALMLRPALWRTHRGPCLKARQAS